MQRCIKHDWEKKKLCLIMILVSFLKKTTKNFQFSIFKIIIMIFFRSLLKEN